MPATLSSICEKENIANKCILMLVNNYLFTMLDKFCNTNRELIAPADVEVCHRVPVAKKPGKPRIKSKF